MKILHVYSGNLYGGIESFLVALARNARLAPPMTSEFALCFEGRLRDDLVAVGAAVHDLGPVRTRAPWTVLRARSRLAEVARKGAFDAIVCHSPWAQAVLGKVPQALGVPGVFWLHEAIRGRHWLERWASRSRPSYCVANSHFSRTTLGLMFRDVPTSVIYCPVDFPHRTLPPEERGALRSELGARNETVVIMQTSRMQPLKGQRRLVHALARLPANSPWLCLQVGGPQRPEEQAYFDELKAEVARLALGDRVRFLGQRSDVSRLLEASDVYCQPNTRPDSFGIVFVEALAAGLPVVTADIGGPREIVSPDVGYLVADDAGLSEVLERLVGDGELRRRLGAQGPARARERDPALRLPEIARVLAAAVERSPRLGAVA